MQESSVQERIPMEVALELCAEIREEAEADWQTPVGRWCWVCQETSGGDPTKRGFLSKPGNRGCLLINARYAEKQH